MAPASEPAIQRAAAALRANNIDVRVVEGEDLARQVVLELVPAGPEVHSGKSKTLQTWAMTALHLPPRTAR